MPTFPPIFLSHGAPNMALNDTPASRFLKTLGQELEKPSGIVVISAHFETDNAVVVADPRPSMIYDFRGFEPELYEMVYPASGDPDLARRVGGLLRQANLPVTLSEDRGFDHGTWVPFSLVFPEADIPIVQLSIDPNQTAEYHYALGQALRELPKDNIAVIGSGNITHNLRALFAKGRDPVLDKNIKSWVEQFLHWLDSELESQNVANLLDYREKAPFAAENHPTDEHFMPLYVAMGAAGRSFEAVKLHASYDYDFLAMDSWKFVPSDVA